MGDNITVDWGAGSSMDPEGPLGVSRNAYKGALMGYDLGQRGAVRHALNGMDLNNPASVSSAIQGLVRAGAADQADSVQTLGLTRQLYPALAAKLVARLNPPSTVSSAPAAPAAAPSPEDAAMAAHGDIMGQAQKAVEHLQSLPLSERPAAAEKVRQQFLDLKVPASAIDGHMDDLSDEGLAKTGQYFADHAGWMQAQGAPGAAGTPAPSHPTDYAWANDLLNDPVMNDPLMVAMMKKIGFDPSATMERAERLIAPWNAAEATASQAGNITAQQEAAKLMFAVPNAMIEAKKAGAIASAQEAAKAPWEFMEIKGADNQPAWVKRDWAKQYAEEHGGVLGQGLSPANQKFQEAQAAQGAELLKPDTAGRNQAADSLASAERALSIIHTLKFDKTTPVKNQIAQALRTAGMEGADKYASDIAAYQQATTDALVKGAHAAFPQRITNTDLQLMHQIYPTLTTPNDAAGLVMGTQAAQALRLQQYEDFKANYSGDHSPQAIQRAWLSGAGGQSILQSPEWAKVRIGGRPAFDPKTDIKTDKNGVHWGAWGVGTGHPVYFEIH